MKIITTIILLTITLSTQAQYYSNDIQEQETNYSYQTPPITSNNYYYQPISTANYYPAQTIQYSTNNGSISNTSIDLVPINNGYNVYKQDLNGFTQIGIISNDGYNTWNYYNYTQQGGLNINPSYTITQTK